MEKCFSTAQAAVLINIKAFCSRLFSRAATTENIYFCQSQVELLLPPPPPSDAVLTLLG
jgi:hypothetical protein